MLSGLLAPAVLALLLRIAGRLRDQDPFRPVNARRLHVGQDVHLTFLPLVVGLAVAVAAEVFRQGTRLRADVEGRL